MPLIESNSLALTIDWVLLEARVFDDENAFPDVKTPKQTPVILLSLSDDVTETTELMRALGYFVFETVLQRRNFPEPKTYIGIGKLEEVKDIIIKNNFDEKIVVVNGNLRPSQHYNLEKNLNATVFDRLGLILEIFTRRARNRESMLQTELARYQYELPFVREWIHRGQVGERPGFLAGGTYKTDQYLEYIRKRISRIRKELEIIQKQNNLRRKRRYEGGVFSVSIAGYTNAGKSSLLNALTNAGVETADKYFTTLDTTTRRTQSSGIPIVLTDTIGLIRDTPPWMIHAFRSTLEESRQSQCIILVLDASEDLQLVINKYLIAENILKRDKPESSNNQTIILLNKCDLLSSEEMKRQEKSFHEITGKTVLWASARTGIGITELAGVLKNVAQHPPGDLKPEIRPHAQPKLLESP